MEHCLECGEELSGKFFVDKPWAKYCYSCFKKRVFSKQKITYRQFNKATGKFEGKYDEPNKKKVD